MNMHPKVSIIVPIYNVERYLDKCITSLVNQTLQDIEIILVDDGSPDNCPSICDEWAKKDERIKVLHKQNEGLGMARNSGIDIATGEYITFCDSDDYVEPATYNELYGKVKEKDLDICWFQACRVRLDGTKIYSRKVVEEEYFEGKEQIRCFLKDVIGRNPEDMNSRTRGMSSCMALFRRGIYIRSGVRYPSERVVASEDFIFLINILPHVNSVGILPDVFYNYLINPCSISSTYSEIKHIRLINMLNVLKDYCDANFEYAEYKNHYFSQVLRIFKVILKYISYSNEPFFSKISHLSTETKHPLLADFYADPIRKKYRWPDKLYIFCMRYHIGIFFVLLYKFKR